MKKAIVIALGAAFLFAGCSKVSRKLNTWFGPAPTPSATPAATVTPKPSPTPKATVTPKPATKK